MAKKAAVAQKDALTTKRALKRLDKVTKELNEIAQLLWGVSDIRSATGALIGIASRSANAACDALSIDLERIERSAR